MRTNQVYHVKETRKKSNSKNICNHAFLLFIGVVVDELETLLEYAPVGPRYSNNVLQTLKLLFKRAPPKGRKLLIIATTTYRDILDQLGLLSSFSKIIHISNMSSGQHILHVLNEIEHCFNDDELRYLERKLHDKK